MGGAGGVEFLTAPSTTNIRRTGRRRFPATPSHRGKTEGRAFWDTRTWKHEGLAVFANRRGNHHFRQKIAIRTRDRKNAFRSRLEAFSMTARNWEVRAVLNLKAAKNSRKPREERLFPEKIVQQHHHHGSLVVDEA